MIKRPVGILPQIEQPYGFDGVRREWRTAYGDSRAFFVNPNHAEATDDNSGEDPAHPLSSITQAISLARAYMGDVIYVMANDGWQYGQLTQAPITEDVIVPVDKPGLAIIGIGQGGMGVTWIPATADGFCLTINALDAVVEGFNFWAPLGGDGISCFWDGVTGFGENAIIRNCTFAEIDIGVQLEYTWYVKIIGCHFDECDEYGIYVDPLGNGVAKCEVADNWFQDCAVAIEFDPAEECNIHDNHIYNANAQGAAVATDEGINTANGARNIVSNNFFSCVLPAAANGDIDDLCTGSATDAWVNNHCLNGDNTTNPT